MAAAAFLCLFVSARLAFADSPETQGEVAAAAGAHEPEATEGDAAVPQDRVSGVRRAPDVEGSAAWLWTRRALLFVPRWAFRAVAAPPRLTLWALDRYSFEAWFKRTFFNEDGTYGLYPFVDVESGFGASVGVAFLDHEIFDRALGTKLSARFGGRSGQTYQTEISPNRAIGGVAKLSLLGRFSLATRSHFFGVGNQDRKSADDVVAPIDPESADAGVRGYYRHRDWLGAVKATIFPGSRFSLRLRLRFLERSYNPGGDDDTLDEPLEGVFDVGQLVGYSEGLRNFYGDVQGVVDLRDIVAKYDNPPVYGTGWLFSASLGAARGIGHDSSRYLRYSVDLRRLFNLYRGDRVLVLRSRMLAVAGGGDAIPFDALPYLGGRDFLRGYDSQRFRDRVTLLATAEYQYPINHYLGGHVFADLGRVYSSFSEVSPDLSGQRLGFGLGLDYRNATGLLARMSVSSSIDGGIYFNLGFESVPDVHTR